MTFNSYYEMIMEYYESDGFRAIPASKLGLSSSLQDLPDSPPHGFWVDRHGNFITVSHLNHANVAIEIFKKAKTIDPQLFVGVHPHPYEGMYENGYMRIAFVRGNGRLLLDYTATSRSISQSQRKFLDFIKDFYDSTDPVFMN